jgi:EAL domain-containing protein (putative c-di-GMP-specific phosphodiesterase class I)
MKEAMQGKCTFTIGAVPIDNTLFLDDTQLLDSVNMTLKKAKHVSNNRIEFFSAEELSRKIASLELLEELKQSVENNFDGFELYYQPQISTGNYDIYGVEALLRYNSKVRGRVFPDEFIPILEESRLIKDVGLWVLKEALRQCRIWRENMPALHMSVNFSALQFEDPDLAEKVIKKVEEAGLPGDALTVEITETIELRNSPQIINTIMELKEYNVNFAIDDFGTGYSNLGYLKQLDVDEIKIDRLFVSGIEKGTYNHKLINNVIEFAKGNDIRTCCEGVENTRELVALETLLPDIFQGYLFDRPNTADVIERTYIDSTAEEYAERLKFINKIHELKEKVGVVHFDPKHILQENEVGLWMMRINTQQERYELHADAVMDKILAAEERLSPTERFDFWISNVRNDYSDKVKDCINEMMLGDCAVQIEFVWCHPEGDVSVRFSGKRVKDSGDLVVLEGYCRNIPNIVASEGEKA